MVGCAGPAMNVSFWALPPAASPSKPSRLGLVVAKILVVSKLLGALLLVTGLVGGLSGCTEAPWTVVRQTEPNPLLYQRQWVVEPLRYDDTRVDGAPLALWIAGRDQMRPYSDPRVVHDPRIDLGTLSDAFVWRLSQPHGTLEVTPAVTKAANGAVTLPPHAFTIRVKVHGISTGLRQMAPGYPPVQAGPAEAFVTVSLLDPEGLELDVVDLQTDLSTDEASAMTGLPLGDCGVRIANRLVEYMKTRIIFRDQ